jgi:hypothetical protein
VGALRIRTAAEWTAFWFFAAAAASLPLATVDMPTSGGFSCGGITTDPAWAAWEYREILWLSLAAFMPVSAGIAAVFAWKTVISVRTCVTVAVVIGFTLVLTNVVFAAATTTCSIDIQLRPGAAGTGWSDHPPLWTGERGR